MRTTALKFALGLAYVKTGFDIRKSADIHARFIPAKVYVPRNGRSSGTDIVAGRERITVYDYSPDPRETPCSKTEYTNPRSFVKSRLDQHVRNHVRPGVATLLDQILTGGKIDVMGYGAKEEKHKATLEEALHRVDTYVRNSLTLTVLERAFFQQSET